MVMMVMVLMVMMVMKEEEEDEEEVMKEEGNDGDDDDDMMICCCCHWKAVWYRVNRYWMNDSHQSMAFYCMKLSLVRFRASGQVQ